MIAVTFAVPHESHALRRRLQRASRAGVRDWVRGFVGEKEIIIAHTGIGPAAAEESAGVLLAKFQPRWLVSAGYAGGLDPALAHGEVFIAENFSTLAMPAIRRATLTTQPRAAASVAEKAALLHTTGAHAVDMETASIARVCAARGVPMLALRAISDTAREPIRVPLEITCDLARQRPRILALLAFLATHPARILPFARFVRGLSPARENLTAALVGIIQNGPPH